MMAKTCKVQTQTNAAAKAGTKAKRATPSAAHLEPPSLFPLSSPAFLVKATFTVVAAFVVVVAPVVPVVPVVASVLNAR